MSEKIEQGATDGPTREFVKALTVVGGAVGVSIALLLRYLKDRART